MIPEPYQACDRDLIVHRQRNRDEYCLIQVTPKNLTLFILLASGPLKPAPRNRNTSNAHAQLLEWSMLGCRHHYEIAASDPPAPRPLPEWIQQLIYFGNPAKTQVIRKTPLPPEIQAAWNTADQTYLDQLIR